MAKGGCLMTAAPGHSALSACAPASTEYPRVFECECDVLTEFDCI